MFTAKFIKNIFLDKECIKAIGRSGKLTKVFAQQGDLDGACGILRYLQQNQALRIQ